MALTLAFLALAFELALGYPRPLARAIGHPVMWVGALIARLDKSWNRPAASARARRGRGVAALAVILATSIAAGIAMSCALLHVPYGLIVTALIATTLIAQRSLDAHVAAVAAALESGGVEAGRRAVAHIVGRDPENLDEAGVARAAIESLAENFSDGVIAPALWLAAFGLPGAMAYKAVNTADSMIGHTTGAHAAFGWASARLDDLMNLPAARATALLIAAAACLCPGASPRAAWRAVWRDAGNHRSPNAGWPEAAMAGALGLALAGPRVYGGRAVDDAVMGEGGRRAATAGDIRKGLRLARIADALFVALIGAGAALATGLSP